MTEDNRLRLTAIAHDMAEGSVGAYYPEAKNLCPLDYQDTAPDSSEWRGTDPRDLMHKHHCKFKE